LETITSLLDTLENNKGNGKCRGKGRQLSPLDRPCYTKGGKEGLGWEKEEQFPPLPAFFRPSRRGKQLGDFRGRRESSSPIEGLIGGLPIPSSLSHPVPFVSLVCCG
jgi:hypothetical protein